MKKPAQGIAIIGTSCSGKTTLAASLSIKLQVRHIELDALHWGPNWFAKPDKKFRQLVLGEIAKGPWVADGNYGIVRDILWKNASTVIWLNYSFFTIFSRALTRTFRRAFTKEILFSGNRESFFTSFFTKDSILLWVLKTYGRRKREFPLLFQKEHYSHLRILELKNQNDTDSFLLEPAKYLKD